MTDALSIHYAHALADAVFSPEAGIQPEEASAQLHSAVAILASEDLRKVLLSPAVPRRRKADVVGRLLEEAGVHRLIRNFIMVVVEHRRIGELERIQDSFDLAIDERQGFVRAEIISAAELDEAQRAQLLHALGTAAGKFIRPVYRTDSSLLGGVIARLGSKEYDGSLTGRLDAMRRRLSPVI